MLLTLTLYVKLMRRHAWLHVLSAAYGGSLGPKFWSLAPPSCLHSGLFIWGLRKPGVFITLS